MLNMQLLNVPELVIWNVKPYMTGRNQPCFCWFYQMQIVIVSQRRPKVYTHCTC